MQRRRILLSLLAATLPLPRTASALPGAQPSLQRLRLFNPHTGETFEGAYRDDRGPVAAAMADLSAFLRDFHCGKTAGIDVGVIDFLAAVMEAIGVRSAIVLSAYRTPETNAMLARTTFGVAEKSQHLYGRALDVRFESRLADAVRAARSMQRGGVGWYPRSGFLHIDTGPVRNWELDDNGLSSLLAGRHNPGPSVGAMTRHDPKSDQILPQWRHSGEPLAILQQSGRPLPALSVARGH